MDFTFKSDIQKTNLNFKYVHVSPSTKTNQPQTKETRIIKTPVGFKQSEAIFFIRCFMQRKVSIATIDRKQEAVPRKTNQFS